MAEHAKNAGMKFMRLLREQAGQTMYSAAKSLGKSISALRYMEESKSDDIIVHILTLYDQTGLTAEDLVALMRESVKPETPDPE
jgi:hypothetical protein